MNTSAPLLTQNGLTFRDLNKNGRLDPYEDPRRPIEERIADLLSQMTLEEKAGMMFHAMIGMNQDGSLVEETQPFNPTSTSEMVGERLINHFNVYRPGHAETDGRMAQPPPETGRSAPAWASR